MRIMQVTADTYDIATGQYVSKPVVLDINITPFQVSCFNSSLSSGAAVQVSYADPYPKVNGNFVEQTNYNWVVAPTTAPNAANFLGQPYTAVRLVANEGDTMTVIQAGIK